MCKKHSLALLVSFLSVGIATMPAAASVKVGMGVDYDLGVNIKFDDTFNIFVGNDGLALDYHFSKGALSNDGSLGYFVGFGGWTDWDDDFGVRMPLGLDWNFASNWNLTGQLNPTFQIQDKSKLKLDAGFGVSYKF